MISLVQDIELVNPSFIYLEELSVEGLVDSPLFQEDDNLGIRKFDDIFYMGRSKEDMRCVYFEGDPIYDIDYESEVDMAELKLYEEPHLGIFHEKDEVDFEERSIIIPSYLMIFPTFEDLSGMHDVLTLKVILSMTLNMRVKLW
jgi:hypothetical protein